MDWFKCDWEDREGRGLTKCSAAMAKSLPPFFYRSAQPARIYLPPTSRMCAFPVSFAEADSPHGSAVDNRTRGMQLSFLFDCDDVALPALKLDPDTELARVVPADVEVCQQAGLHDLECGCDNR